MNVLAISSNYPHESDPACGVFAARQFVEMHKLGADVTVLVPHPYVPSFMTHFERYKPYRSRKLISYDGIKSHIFRFFRFPGRWMLKWDGMSAFEFSKSLIRRLHKKNPFDIIYARGFWLESDIAIRSSKLLGIPAVGVGIGTDVNVRPKFGASFHKYFVDIANRLDCTMATGRGVADQIDAVSDKKTTVIGGLVDLHEFSPPINKKAVRKQLGLLSDAFILLFTGHIIKSKGIYELIDAFREVNNVYPEVILKICGTGAETGALRQHINNCGISHSVELVGNVDPGDMHKWMQASDIFVLPSYREGMPNVVMEAMACGLPVVTTAVGGLPAAIGDCQGAVLVQPENTDQLKNALLRIISDVSFQKEMSVASRKRAEGKFNINRNTQIVINQLRKTVNGCQKK